MLHRPKATSQDLATMRMIADGDITWFNTVQNLVTTGGKTDALDKYLAGSVYTAAWYPGLIASAS